MEGIPTAGVEENCGIGVAPGAEREAWLCGASCKGRLSLLAPIRNS